jgi:hypothetical protein
MSSSSSSVSSSIGNPTYGRGIWLRRYAQTRYVASNIEGFRFKAVTYGANLMPEKIFRYGREALNAREGTFVLSFDGVCSPSDLEEFPEEEPTVNSFPEFCRLNYVDLVFRTQAQAEDTWQNIISEVTSLVNTLNTMDNITNETSLKFGDPPPSDGPPVSSSSSSV